MLLMTKIVVFLLNRIVKPKTTVHPRNLRETVLMGMTSNFYWTFFEHQNVAFEQFWWTQYLFVLSTKLFESVNNFNSIFFFLIQMENVSLFRSKINLSINKLLAIIIADNRWQKSIGFVTNNEKMETKAHNF